MKILKRNTFVSTHRQGRIVGITAQDITDALGVESVGPSGDDKCKDIWDFNVKFNGKVYPCGIWDYKGSQEEGIYSYYGDYEIMEEIFSDFEVISETYG